VTKKELEQMAQKSLTENEITHWSTGTYGFHKGFEACYRLLTTPRPMSEAPDGISAFILFYDDASWGVAMMFKGAYYWEEDVRSYNYVDYPPKPLDLATYAGWLPIFTPIEEDAN